MKIIESNIEKLRDPFVLAKNGTYYIYGSEWVCYKSLGDLEHWTKCENELVVIPKEFDGDKWAPEVYGYKGAYYMFTTYRSSKTKRHGCTIMKSNSPEGPFTEITNGHITPADWDCIDGTFYIDESNQPWMVFVHEWITADDGVGRMAAAKLSDDLTHFVSEPIELFRADDPSWATGVITDGCFIYKTEDNQLLMLWSNFDKNGYCVAIARSDNGKIDGKWSQEDKVLFSKSGSEKYDGGHGMIFCGFDGKKYLSIHSPNVPVGTRSEKPVFIELQEYYDSDMRKKSLKL
ncbi:MAG: glycoside hydrolase family 43 protein [Clostridiales bacterium]|nr:glycoside hydrolase family 43 protein [Clostridiales bacterium]